MSSTILDNARAALHSQRLDEALHLVEQARVAAVTAGAGATLDDALLLKCSVFIAKRELNEARDTARVLMARATEDQSDRTMALAHLARAHCLYAVDQIGEMEEAARASRRAAERHGGAFILARTDNLLAIAASIRGDTSTALLRYGSALANFTEIADAYNVAGVRTNIAWLQIQSGEAISAIEHYEMAIEYMRRTGASLSLPLAGYAEALAMVGRAVEALAVADEAIAVAAPKDGRTMATAYFAQGCAVLASGDRQGALQSLSVALALAEGDVPDHDLGARMAAYLAEIHLDAEHYGDALAALERVERKFDLLGAGHLPGRVRERLDRVRNRVMERLREWIREGELRNRGMLEHAERVAAHAMALARHLSLSAEECRWCEVGALLHDVGYTLLPASAFPKAPIFGAAQREVMQLHTVFGEDQLRKAGFPVIVRVIVRGHHERWDGRGYPDRLRADEIPLLVRVVAIAERFEALRSARDGTRVRLSRAEAIERLKAEGGTAYDPVLVGHAIELLASQTPGTAEDASREARDAWSTSHSDHTATPTADAHALPRELKKALGAGFTVDSEMKGGGMSRVFRATDLMLKRAVVVKVLDDPEGAENEERFRREMAISANLSHPNIVPVLHAGAGNGLCYFVMPLIGGTSLRHLMERDERLPVERAVRLLRDIAAALSYAHARGVTHRDIKPENVLVDDDRALVMDFGIARSAITGTTDLPATRRATITRVGSSIGTPGYMSPEQILGDGEPGPAMDVYAFGAMAFELLAGEPPLKASSSNALLMAHIYQIPPPLGSKCPELAPRICELVDAALNKVPSERPVNGSVLLRGLAST